MSMQMSYLLPDTEEVIAGHQCADNSKLSELSVYTSRMGANLDDFGDPTIPGSSRSFPQINSSFPTPANYIQYPGD